MQEFYTTKQIADSVGIHVNTVRFYEEIGFITKPERRSNGYRMYTRLQLDQCRLIRRAMQAEVLQNGLRKQAVAVVRLCAARNFEAAQAAAEEYSRMIATEINNAQAAVAAVEKILRHDADENSLFIRQQLALDKNSFIAKQQFDPGSLILKRREAAAALNVTPETLRTWERSGLLKIERRQNGCRAYTTADMERLNIIRTLRCANYSLAAILRLLNGLDRHEDSTIAALLNTPGTEEDIISVCDQLIISLHNTAADAQILLEMIGELKEKYAALQ